MSWGREGLQDQLASILSGLLAYSASISLMISLIVNALLHYAQRQLSDTAETPSICPLSFSGKLILQEVNKSESTAEYSSNKSKEASETDQVLLFPFQIIFCLPFPACLLYVIDSHVVIQARPAWPACMSAIKKTFYSEGHK